MASYLKVFFILKVKANFILKFSSWNTPLLGLEEVLKKTGVVTRCGHFFKTLGWHLIKYCTLLDRLSSIQL